MSELLENAVRRKEVLKHLILLKIFACFSGSRKNLRTLRLRLPCLLAPAPLPMSSAISSSLLTLE